MDDKKIFRRYIIFGAGSEGKRVLGLLGKEKVDYFCDNNVNLHGKNVNGVKVISYDEFKNIHYEYNVIVATKGIYNRDKIFSQLRHDNVQFNTLGSLTEELFQKDIEKYVKLNTRETFNYTKELEFICPYDKFDEAGSLTSYFWQDLWAARHIFMNKPDVHYDIGSRIDGFIGHLISFGQEVRLIDIRSFETKLPGVEFIHSDATCLDIIPDNSIMSLSALCSIEHFGLGRYGDEIDPEACFKCFSAMQKKICSEGYLYISLPVGKEHLEFNAHRVFYASTVIDSFPEMQLIEFSSSYGNHIEYNVDINKYDDLLWERGRRFGLFVFKKR